MASSDVFVTFGGDTGALEAAVAAVKSQMATLAREMRTTATEFNKTGRAVESEFGQKLKSLGSEMAAAKSHLGTLQAGAKAGGDEIHRLAERIGDAAWNFGPWSGMHVQIAQIIGETLVRAASTASVAMTGLGVAFGAAAVAATASLAIVGAQVKTLRDLDDAARGAKVSIAALRDLNTAGAAVGMDAATMNQEMSGFAQKLREAEVSGGDLADFLKANNIAIKDAAGNLLPVQEIFGKIAGLINNSNNEMDKLAALTKLGFSSDWLRLFERQSDAVKTFATSTESAQDAVMRRGMSDGEALSAAWQSTWSAIKETALSASVSVLSSIGEIEHRGAAEFSQLADQAKAAFDRMTGDARGAAQAIEQAFATQAAEVMRREAMAVAGGKSPFGTLNAAAFGATSAPAAPSDQPSIQGLYDKDSGSDKSDTEERQAEIKAIDDEISALEKEEKAKEQLYQEGAKIGILSAEQKLAASQAALDQEYNAEKALLQKELQIDGLTPSQKQSINDKLTALDQKYASDSQKIFMQSVESQIKTWDKMIDTISNSMSSGIMGLIEHTEKFKQAMLKVEESIVQQFIKMGVDIVASWAKAMVAQVVLSQSAEGQKTAAALAGASTREAAGAAEAASGVSALIANAVKSITVDAGVAGAGAAAQSAPVLGPGAVAEGAAVKGAVLSMAAFDIGAYSIDQDQIAMVHKNELVMPAAEAGAFRSMLSGAAHGGAAGGDTHNYNGDVHVHTTTQGAMAMAKADPKGFAQALSYLVRHNHLRFA